MEPILNDVKEIMDSTVLKDIDFNEKHKANVMRRLDQTQVKKRIHFKPLMMNVVSFTLTSLFLLVAGYFVANELELFPSNDKLATEIKSGEVNFDPIVALDNDMNIRNPDILPTVEFKNVEEFILTAKRELNANPPSFADPSKELWQFDVASWITPYSKHFAAISTDTEEIRLLRDIEEASLMLFKNGDPIQPKENQKELVANLNSALDEFIKTKITNEN